MFRPSQAIVALLLLPATAQEAPKTVSEQRLDAAFADARAAVEAALAVKLDAALAVTVVDSETIAKRVTQENLPIVRLREPDEQKAAAQAKTLGQAFAEFAFAKYAWSTGEVLVVPSLWQRLATAFQRPELTGDAALRAVLVHELVHAADHAAHGFDRTLSTLSTVDAVGAYNAVIEGHAQHVARRVCAQRGWAAGFDVFTATIGAIPPGAAAQGEAMLLLLRVTSATLSTAYLEGERFVAAIEAQGGAEAVARAFREPPRDSEAIFHPEWFLDPHKRPVPEYDMEPAVALLLERFPAETWNRQVLSITPAQIEASLSLLPPETVRRIRGSLLANRAAVLTPSADPASKMVVVVIFDFGTAEAAGAFVEAAAALGRIKDEKMKTGVARITQSQSSAIDRDGLRGFRHHKKMVNGPLKFDVLGVFASRGRLAIETTFSAEAIEDADHEALAITVLDAVRKLELKQEQR